MPSLAVIIFSDCKDTTIRKILRIVGGSIKSALWRCGHGAQGMEFF